MTVLIQEMSNTVIAAVNTWTFTVADFTVLPKKGVFKVVLDKNPALKEWVLGFVQRKVEEKRVREGFQVQDPDDIALQLTETAGSADAVVSRGCVVGRAGDEEDVPPDVKPPEDDRIAQIGPTPPPTDDGEGDETAEEDDSDHDLARHLAQAVKGVAQDLRAHPPKRYSFEEWVHFTKLIRFSRRDRDQALATIEEDVEEEEQEGLIEWDWLGEDSPMLADITEAEWLLDRLCESLNRYTKRQAKLASRRSHVPRRLGDEVE